MSTTTSTGRIVSVWLDDDSDESAWVVDTDSREGGESDTLATYPPTDAGFERAVARGKRAAKKRGCDVHIINGVSRIVIAAADVQI